MKTYWDYSQQERAALTQDQVSQMLDLELMAAGVLKPVPPTLTEIATVPVGNRIKFFGVSCKNKYGSNEYLGICFSTLEQAQAFIDLRPFKSDYDYAIGNQFIYAISLIDCVIGTEELYSLDQINQFRSQLVVRKQVAEKNEKALSAFNVASSKAEDATKSVWSDWYGCRETLSSLSAVVSTYKEYVKMTGGDASIALTFLEKAYSNDKITQAREWFPDAIIQRPEATAQ